MVTDVTQLPTELVMNIATNFDVIHTVNILIIDTLTNLLT
jgi:hypothetical protein